MTQLLLRRLVARAIDAFTILFLTFGCAVSVLVLVMDPLTRALDIGPWGRTLAPLLLYVTIGLVYETVFVARCGQTPGKDIMNIRVLDATSGELPSWRAALSRAALMGLPRLVPGLVLGTLAPLGAAASVPAGSQRQGLHDLACGTRVEFYDADAAAEAEGLVEMDGVGWTQATSGLVSQYGPRSWWQQLSTRAGGGNR